MPAELPPQWSIHQFGWSCHSLSCHWWLFRWWRYPTWIANCCRSIRWCYPIRCDGDGDGGGAPLGLPGGLLLERTRIDAVVFEDLIHGTLNDRIEVRGVARLFGRLDGGGDGRSKLIL